MKATVTLFLENEAGDYKVKSLSPKGPWKMRMLPESISTIMKANPGYIVQGFKVMFERRKKKC